RGGVRELYWRYSGFPPPAERPPMRILAFSLAFCLVTSPTLVVPARGDEPARWAKAHVDELFTLYRHFHQNPELSHQEKETSARLAKELKDAGLEVTTGVGGYGVVGMLKNGDGPKI